MYDLIIIGGGPAGMSAAIYAGRKKLNTLLIAEMPAGQSAVSDEIQNWVGDKSISGPELAKKMEEHARAQESIKFKIGERVEKIEKTDGFKVFTDKGQEHEARAIVLASGSHRKKLGVPGETDLEGKGVFYCSTCDAPLFGGKTTAVIGGGNAALEAAVDLMPYADKIYLLVRSDKLKGDAVTQEKVKSSDKVEIIFNAETKRIMGDKFVEALRYRDLHAGEDKEIKVDGIFVEIGSAPNSDPVKGLAVTNKKGEVVIDHKTGATSVEGIWAAGDVTDAAYKQNNISAGDAIKATLSAYKFLQNQNAK